MKSVIDKLTDVTPNADGSITHNTFKAKDGSPRKFKDNDTYKRWLAKHHRERKEELKLKITPHQFYITQG